MLRPTIYDGHDESSWRLQFFLQFPTTGELFVGLGEDERNAGKYKQAASDRINKFQHQFQDPGAAGHCYVVSSQERPFEEELVAKFKSYGRVKVKSPATSSIAAIHGSAPYDSAPWRIPIHCSALKTPPEPCPSLESDHSSDGRGAADEYDLAMPAASKRPSRQPDSSIFASIRQVLSSDPSFAEKVISAVNELPHDKRILFLESESECVDGSSSNPSQSSQRPSKKRRTTESNGSNRNGGGFNGHNPPGESGGAGGGSGSGSRDGDGEGQEGGGGRDSNTPSNKNRYWICPYCLVYLEIYGITVFRHCSLKNMNEVHLWRSHFVKRHSPEAKNADSNAEKNAKFYMEPEELTAVLERIDFYNKERPRPIAEWTSHWTDLFNEVCRIIFPKTRFPHLKERIFPFHLDRNEIADLGQHLDRQAKALVGIFSGIRADEAVKAESIASRDDFRPTAQDTNDFISKALAVVLLNSQAATGGTQWLARASPQTLEAAVEQEEHDSGSLLKTSVVTPSNLHVPTEPNGGGPATLSKLATVPMTPEPIVINPNAVQAVPPVPTMSVPVPLFPNGTRVELSPTNPNSYQTDTPSAQLTIPSTFFVSRTSPIPPPQPVMEYMQDTTWDPSTQLSGGQGISMQNIQENPFNPEEYALLENGGPTLI
ncbi:hypothetical protein F53441_7237 [Fusarium austroafricanum]|uniref:Uncharacterized protein n=1 Tax=Fusarium austroafricanum TaxID=2364996 RepID=A0A8H4KFL3_9HYPO|nr:hypothetical protein F53441_7237 [Fusarium austroafricanum]